MLHSISHKVAQFTESVIREMTRLAQRHGAVNLGQGMPDFDPPPEVKDAACRAVLSPCPAASTPIILAFVSMKG